MPRVTKASTKARRSEERQRRNEAILDTVERVFREKGYVATTTEEIAQAAGVGVGTIYNSFSSKERLYGAVIERIADALLEKMRDLASRPLDAEEVLEALIRMRLADYDRHRLFFVLFSCEQSSDAYPQPEALSDRVVSSYYRYLDMVGKLLERGVEARLFEGIHPLYLALSFEGVLGAFMGYWSRPEQSEPLDAQVQRVKETLLKVAAPKTGTRVDGTADTQANMEPSREIFITRYDFQRLKELIAVARGFGNEEIARHLSDLDLGLGRGRIVDPKLVPPDVVTMNSRVLLQEPDGGESQVRSLVFPVDAGKSAENVSILEPMGTAMLGCRVGSVMQFDEAGQQKRLRVRAIQYQPESAGDYHL
ncbi:MAG TPA: TetR family transcriptional regulator [Phycisphaerae bacterium]|nr:TetR family transcriptional regulator [Phycisphaerae bacterium]